MKTYPKYDDSGYVFTIPDSLSCRHEKMLQFGMNRNGPEEKHTATIFQKVLVPNTTEVTDFHFRSIPGLHCPEEWHKT